MEEGLAARTRALHAGFGRADRGHNPEVAPPEEALPPGETPPDTGEATAQMKETDPATIALDDIQDQQLDDTAQP